MHSRERRVGRALRDILIGIVIFVLLAMLLNNVQTSLSVQRQQDNSLTKLGIATRRLAQNTLEAQEKLATYDAFGQAKIDTVA